MIPYLFFAVLLSFALYHGYQVGYRHWNRKRLHRTPFPEAWSKILTDSIPIYTKLSESEKKQLHTATQIFISEKSFVGLEGLDVTDEMRVIIAAQACLLLLNRPTTYYPWLRQIFIRPGAYTHQDHHVDEHGVKSSKKVTRLGESWTRGRVVLSWEHSQKGGANFTDGHNVVIHEFAHQLDQEDGNADGAPILNARGSYQTWARLLRPEFDKLQKQQGKKRRRPVLRDYGATNAAEFFAVASEAFFEKPRQLKKKHPDVYEALADYYQVKPEDWD